MSLGDYESSEETLPDEVHKKALEMFEVDFGIPGEEYDLGELFVRILWERDWTDKLGSFLGKIRHRFHLRHADTKLPKELRALIPDVNEVAGAYEEMKSGYKEFIRNVLEAKHPWHEDE